MSAPVVTVAAEPRGYPPAIDDAGLPFVVTKRAASPCVGQPCAVLSCAALPYAVLPCVALPCAARPSVALPVLPCGALARNAEPAGRGLQQAFRLRADVVVP